MPSKTRPGPSPSTVSAMESLIRRTARRHGVPEPIALATAWLESRMNPDAEGDLLWHLDEDRFERVVPNDFSWRWQRDLWHSYGLFQLLAPYHVARSENPTVLLDPEINANRAMVALKRLIKRHKGDVNAVRLAYTNQDAKRNTDPVRTLQKWHFALAKYGYDEPLP